MFRGELDEICAGYFGGDKVDTFQIMNNESTFGDGVSLCQNLRSSSQVQEVNEARADLGISIQNRTVFVYINKLNIKGDTNVFKNCSPGVCVCVDVPTGAGYVPAIIDDNGTVTKNRNYRSDAMSHAQWLVKPLEFIDENTPTKRTYAFELPSIERLPSWNRVKSTFKRRYERFWLNSYQDFLPYLVLNPSIVGFRWQNEIVSISNFGYNMPTYAFGDWSKSCKYFLLEEEIQKVIN